MGAIQRPYRWPSRTDNVYLVAVPAVPVVITEVIEVLHAPFSGGAAPLDIRVVILGLVIQVPDMVVRDTCSIVGVDIASVHVTAGDYVCVFDSVCTFGDVAGPIYLQEVGRDSRALLENPEALGCREVVFAIIPLKVLILACLWYCNG